MHKRENEKIEIEIEPDVHDVYTYEKKRTLKRGE
jgi:hypothetical protein